MLKWIGSLVFIILILALYLMTTNKIEIVTPGQGIISGKQEDIDIITPDSGFVNQLGVDIGEEVQQGQVLFSYINLDDFSKEQSITNLISMIQDHLKDNVYKIGVFYRLYGQLLNGLSEPFHHQSVQKDADLLRLINQFNSLIIKKQTSVDKEDVYNREQAGVLAEIEVLKDKVELLEKSKSPKINILDAYTELSRLKVSLINLDEKKLINQQLFKNDVNEFKRALMEQIAALTQQNKTYQRELLEYSDAIKHVKSKLKANIIRAPIDGTLLDMDNSFTIGSYITESQKVLTIKQAQQDSLIKAEIAAKYRPFVHVGSKVKMVIDAPGSETFFYGTVTKISIDSFEDKKAPHANERVYKIDVEPEDESHLDQELVGVQVNLYILNKEINLMQYIMTLLSNNLYFNAW